MNRVAIGGGYSYITEGKQEDKILNLSNNKELEKIKEINNNNNKILKISHYHKNTNNNTLENEDENKYDFENKEVEGDW